MAQTPEGALKIAAKKAGMDVAAFAEMRLTQKRCTCCKKWHPLSDFNVDKSRFDGLSAKCVNCSRVKIRVQTKGRTSPMKGMKFSKEARANMGRPSGFSSCAKGIPRTDEVRNKISESVRKVALRGDKAPGYIDGKGLERRGIRLSSSGKRWRYDVMARDGWMCLHCGDDAGGNLNAHHIFHWASHPDKRFDLENGATLCDPCHKLIHRHDIPGF